MKLWGLAGLFIPLAIMLTTRLQGGVFEWPYLGLILWPSWVFPAAADSYYDPDPRTVAIFTAVGIGLNVVLYMGVGALVGWLHGLISKALKKTLSH
jgi:hypothetical protein